MSDSETDPLLSSDMSDTNEPSPSGRASPTLPQPGQSHPTPTTPPNIPDEGTPENANTAWRKEMERELLRLRTMVEMSEEATPRSGLPPTPAFRFGQTPPRNQQPRIPPPHFDSKDTESAFEFVQRFDIVAESNNWDDVSKARVFASCLDSAGLTWFGALTPDVKAAYPRIKRHFLRRFHVGNQFEVDRKFQGLYVQSAPDLDWYATTLQRLGSILERDPTSILKQFLIGLPDAIYRWVELKQPHNMDEALSHARNAFTMFPTTDNRNSRTMRRDNPPPKPFQRDYTPDRFRSNREFSNDRYQHVRDPSTDRQAHFRDYTPTRHPTTFVDNRRTATPDRPRISRTPDRHRVVDQHTRTPPSTNKFQPPPTRVEEPMDVDSSRGRLRKMYHLSGEEMPPNEQPMEIPNVYSVEVDRSFTCHVCSGFGHYARHCPSRRDKSTEYKHPSNGYPRYNRPVTDSKQQVTFDKAS